MYNKIFTKILDSSIWLESAATRIVWVVFIATHDEDGFAAFASPANLARRAAVSMEECLEAIRILESPDTNSSDPENEGRRIERVPGGWMVLNAKKYRDIVKREVGREQTRQRVAAFRARKAQAAGNAIVTECNGHETECNKMFDSSSSESGSITNAAAEGKRTLDQDGEDTAAAAPDGNQSPAAPRRPAAERAHALAVRLGGRDDVGPEEWLNVFRGCKTVEALWRSSTFPITMPSNFARLRREKGV